MIYVSSKLRHRLLWIGAAFPISSTWIHGEQLPPEKCSAMWNRYRSEISSSEAFLLYLEQGDHLKGCLLEMGMAFESRIPIYIVWNGEMSELASIVGTIVYHESVTVVPSMREAERRLLSLFHQDGSPISASGSR